MIDLFVSVVIPLHKYLEMENYLEELSDVLNQNYTNYEIVIIDDSLSIQNKKQFDKILQKIEYVRYIRLSRHYDDNIRTFAGLDSAIGDFVVVINPETDPVAIITSAVEKCKSNFGIVFGVYSNIRENLILGAISQIFYWYANKILGLNIIKNATGFVVLSRQVVNAITQVGDTSREMRTISSIVGFDIDVYEYEPKLRKHRRLWQRFKEAIKILLSKSPHLLRIASILGAIAAGFNVIYVFYVILINIIKRNVVEGWTTTSLQTSFMFFMLFLILVIISEYLYMILSELRDIPSYFIVEEKNSSVLFRGEKIGNLSQES